MSVVYHCPMCGAKYTGVAHDKAYAQLQATEDELKRLRAWRKHWESVVIPFIAERDAQAAATLNAVIGELADLKIKLGNIPVDALNAILTASNFPPRGTNLVIHLHAPAMDVLTALGWLYSISPVQSVEVPDSALERETPAAGRDA